MLLYGQMLNVVQFQSLVFLNLLWLSGLQMLWITVSLFPSLIQHWPCKSCLGKLTLEPIETGLYRFHYGKTPLVICGGIEINFLYPPLWELKTVQEKKAWFALFLFHFGAIKLWHGDTLGMYLLVLPRRLYHSSSQDDFDFVVEC